MKTKYTQLKKPDRAKRIDQLAQCWAEPKLIAATVGISETVTHRYLKQLGYRRTYITDDEAALVVGYRKSKQEPTA